MLDEQVRAARILQQVPDVISVVDPEGRVLFVNDAVHRLLCPETGETTGTVAITHVHPDDQEQAAADQAYLLEEPGRALTSVVRVRGADGRWRHVEAHGVNLLEDPEVGGLLYVTRDVEDRAQAESALLRALGAQRIVSELGLRALETDDLPGLLDQALSRVGSVLGAAWVTLGQRSPEESMHVLRQLGPAPAAAGTPWSCARPPAHLHELDAVLSGPGGPVGVLSVHSERDFSPADEHFVQGVANVLAGALLRDTRQREAVTAALHDELTGLATRPLLTYRLDQALRRSDREGVPIALLMIDLDHFKQVNDRHGHAAGDAVLRELGPRLAACVRASDTVARYGGDEFVVLCDEVVHHVPVAQLATRIRAACSRPFQLADGTTVRLAGSVGLAWSTDVGTRPAALLAAADEAMYRDKRRPDRSR